VLTYMDKEGGVAVGGRVACKHKECELDDCGCSG